jgi:WD40 repeat protein
MSEPFNDLPLVTARRLDEVCRRFEVASAAGDQPQVEDYLGDETGPERAALLGELLALDLEYRRKWGEHPQADDYVARFSGDIDLVAQVWDAAGSTDGSPRPAPGLRPDTSDGIRAAAEPPSRSPDGLPEVSGFRLLRLLGRGGMGVVYLAEQPSLNRTVALKMIARLDQWEAASRRFRVEAEAIARLQHPNIVEIFEVGVASGQPYLVLEYLDGGSLNERFRGGEAGVAEAARLVATLARAMHHAHCMGIVHRDLKPSNVLFARDGVPKITDFGLAKAVGDPSDLTRSEQVIGTPAYMAPEQARGDSLHVGPATDVHALGVILYELLTGRRPFPGDTPLEVLHAMTTVEPPPPHRVRPQVPRDLEAICLRCLQKEPASRYPSACELAEDLDRFLQGRPTVARPVSVAGRVARWCRRNPVPAGLLATLAVVFVTSFVLVTWMWRDADEQRRYAEVKAEEETKARKDAQEARGQAEARRAVAEGLRKDLARESGVALLRVGIGAAERGFVDQGLHWMARGLAVAEREQLTDIAGAIRLNLAHWERRLVRERTSRSEGEGLVNLAFSPDGRWVVGVRGNKRVAQLWDPVTGSPVGEPLASSVQALTFSRDGKLLVLVATTPEAKGAIHLWRRSTLESRFEPGGPPLPAATDADRIVLSADGRTLLLEAFDGLHVCDLVTRKAPWPLKPAGKVPRGARGKGAFSGTDRQTVLTVHADGALQRWDARTGKPLGAALSVAERQAKGARVQKEIICLAFSPDGRTVVTGCAVRDSRNPSSMQYEVRLWDADTGRPRTSPLPHRFRPRSLSFDPGGRVLVVEGPAAPVEGIATPVREGVIQLWDVATGQALGKPLPHPREVTVSALGPDARLLATGCEDGHARLWEVATGKPVGAPLRHDQARDIRAAAFSPDGTLLVTAALARGEPWVWEVPRGRGTWLSVPRPRELLLLPVCALSPDSRRVALTVLGKAARVYDLATGAPVSPELQHARQVESVAFGPDGKGLLTACRDGTVRLWEVPDGKALPLVLKQKITKPLASPIRATFSPDGRTILTCGASSAARLWDAASGQPRGAPLGHDGIVTCGAFHPDSRTVATGSSDATVRLWNATTGAPVGLALKHRTEVKAVAFSPDGKYLLTGCQDGIGQVWDVAQARPVGPSLAHPTFVTCVGFHPTGRTILTGAAMPDGQVRLWDRATGLPVGAPFGPVGLQEHTLSAEFTRDGRRLVMTGPHTSLLQVWDVPEPVPGDAEHVQAWVRVRTGRILDEQGAFRPLDQHTLEKDRRRLATGVAGKGS